jgi:Outer membrane lipoprotein-sorting protein
MKSVARRLAHCILAGTLLGVAPAAFADNDPSGAGELIAQVVAARQTIGYKVRARLVRTTSGSGQRDVRQLLIKGRRKGDDSKVLYSILWPASSLGETVVIEKTAGQNSHAWRFVPPDRMATLTPEEVSGPFFGSDLSVEDLAEEFWHWPTQEIVGEDTVSHHRCKILESRPSAGTATSYSLVRTWIAPDISLPLRVEKFGPDGRLIKRITAEKITRRKNNYWTAANVIVEPADGRTRTVLEGSHADRDIEIPDEDFTVEQIKAGLHPQP